jgi:hypothetical protein
VNVTASATDGADQNSGVYNSGSSPTMTGVTATAWGDTSENYGVFSFDSAPTMTDVTARASVGMNSYGVYNSSSSPTMTDVTASARDGTDNYGVWSFGGSPTMTNVRASASGGTDSNWGVYNLGTLGAYFVTVNNSQSTGSSGSIFNDIAFTTSVFASLLSGGPVENYGILTCAGVSDENYVFYPSTCP